MDISEIEKSKAINVVDIIEYIPESVAIKTILKKSTGFITVYSVDNDQGLTAKTSPFDSFLQFIDGQAEIVMNRKSIVLSAGESIVIPGHTPYFIRSHGRFTMIMTVIKSGYE